MKQTAAVSENRNETGKTETGKTQTAEALVEACDDGGTIQAVDMLRIAPGRPDLHSAQTLRGAAIALGVADEVCDALGVEW